MTHQKYAIAYMSHITMTALLQRNKVLEHIAAQATFNNHNSGINGFLLFKKGVFFEYIEGEEIVCSNLVHRVQFDKRHKNMQILMQGAISTERFKDWRMYWEHQQDKDGIFTLSPLLSLFNVSDWQTDDIQDVVNCIANQDLIIAQRLTK